jgi:hypothetical protein
VQPGQPNFHAVAAGLDHGPLPEVLLSTRIATVSHKVLAKHKPPKPVLSEEAQQALMRKIMKPWRSVLQTQTRISNIKDLEAKHSFRCDVQANDVRLVFEHGQKQV